MPKPGYTWHLGHHRRRHPPYLGLTMFAVTIMIVIMIIWGLRDTISTYTVMSGADSSAVLTTGAFWDFVLPYNATVIGFTLMAVPTSPIYEGQGVTYTLSTVATQNSGSADVPLIAVARNSTDEHGGPVEFGMRPTELQAQTRYRFTYRLGLAEIAGSTKGTPAESSAGPWQKTPWYPYFSLAFEPVNWFSRWWVESRYNTSPPPAEPAVGCTDDMVGNYFTYINYQNPKGPAPTLDPACTSSDLSRWIVLNYPDYQPTLACNPDALEALFQWQTNPKIAGPRPDLPPPCNVDNYRWYLAARDYWTSQRSVANPHTLPNPGDTQNALLGGADEWISDLTAPDPSADTTIIFPTGNAYITWMTNPDGSLQIRKRA